MKIWISQSFELFKTVMSDCTGAFQKNMSNVIKGLKVAITIASENHLFFMDTLMRRVEIPAAQIRGRFLAIRAQLRLCLPLCESSVFDRFHTVLRWLVGVM